jgi:DNA-binding transcriptional MocR family regulator
VIHLSTFSKLLFPGLRIGWLAASQHVIERITRTRQFIDIQSNTLGEYVFYEFLREDLIERHLIKLRNLYSRKRDIMISALGKYCSSLMTWNKPGGGFHIWCRLNKGLSSRELLRESFYEKVTFLAGGVFFPEDVEGDQWLRLSFTYQPEDLIWEGIKRLSNALKRLEKKSQARIMPGRSLAIPIV